MFFLGIAAFLLFFLSDWNDWRFHKAPLRLCFPAGILLLAASLVVQAVQNAAPVGPAVQIPAGCLGLICLWFLLRSLFFDLSAADAYARQDPRRPVCTTGMYALCRHPGVLWSAPLLLCLWLAVGLPLLSAGTYFVLNLLLGLFEDLLVFPAVLAGYDEYRKSTPFLLPNGASIRAAFPCKR